MEDSEETGVDETDVVSHGVAVVDAYYRRRDIRDVERISSFF